MIMCNLNELAHQCNLTPAMRQGLEFLQSLTVDNVYGDAEFGTELVYDIADGHIHVMVREFEGNEPIRFEGHRGVVEFQYVLRGQMNTGWTPAANVVVDKPYNLERDMYAGTAPDKEVSRVLLKPGQLAVWWPEDAHSLGTTPEGETATKVTLKIDLGW